MTLRVFSILLRAEAPIRCRSGIFTPAISHIDVGEDIITIFHLLRAVFSLYLNQGSNVRFLFLFHFPALVYFLQMDQVIGRCSTQSGGGPP